LENIAAQEELKTERKAYISDGLDIEGRDFECPFCHRMFEKWGIHNISPENTDNIHPSVERDINLRKPNMNSWRSLNPT